MIDSRIPPKVRARMAASMHAQQIADCPCGGAAPPRESFPVVPGWMTTAGIPVVGVPARLSVCADNTWAVKCLACGRVRKGDTADAARAAWAAPDASREASA